MRIPQEIWKIILIGARHPVHKSITVLGVWHFFLCGIHKRKHAYKTHTIRIQKCIHVYKYVYLPSRCELCRHVCLYTRMYANFGRVYDMFTGLQLCIFALFATIESLFSSYSFISNKLYERKGLIESEIKNGSH